MADGTLVVVLQSDLLDEIATRVVAPLLPVETFSRIMDTLNPVVMVGERRHVLMPQMMATLTAAELGTAVGSLGVYRDEITRALDALWSGI